MWKPYSIRNEFLLTLIAGGMCATMHYVLIQPEHFEESVNVFALIGLILICSKWLVFPARAAKKRGEQTPFNFCCGCMGMFDIGCWNFYERCLW